MKKLLALILISATFVLSGCSTGPTVMDIKDSPLNEDMQKVGVEKAITKVLRRRGWRVDKKEKGAIQATVHVRSHKATVLIKYTKSTYSLTYVDSVNLKYDASNGTIHRSYNKWVNTLDRDLQRFVD